MTIRTFDILQASLKLENGELLKILHPKLKQKKGRIYVTGFLDPSEYLDIKDLNEKVGMGRNPSVKEYSIVGVSSHGEEIEISKVHCFKLAYTGLKATFSCHGSLRYGVQSNWKNNTIYSISIEGLVLEHNRRTIVEKKRTVFSNEEKNTISDTIDYTECILKFRFENVDHDLNVTFEEGQENNVLMRFHGHDGFDLDTYKKIKYQLRLFLSFASRNALVFRKEVYNENNSEYREIYSTHAIKKQNNSKYIALGNIHFRNKNILQDYLNCFEIYLIADEFLFLSEVIFLFNQSKKVDIECSFFIILIALEKLADRFIKSPFNLIKNEYIIDPENFKVLIENTKSAFNKDFSGLKIIEKQALNSKLCAINKKGKTDKKFDSLLEFSEIPATIETKSLLTTMRNRAIHEGEMNYPEGTAFDNYNSLELLFNNIIANIIQYKGLRFIKPENGKNLSEQKTNYKFNYLDKLQ